MGSSCGRVPSNGCLGYGAYRFEFRVSFRGSLKVFFNFFSRFFWSSGSGNMWIEFRVSGVGSIGCCKGAIEGLGFKIYGLPQPRPRTSELEAQSPKLEASYEHTG